jgi:hypothetical protein
MPRMVDLNVTTYWWIPGATGITPDAISAALLTAGANISAYVVSTTKVEPSASDVVSEKSITDTANASVPTIGNYTGSLVLFRDFSAGVPTATDPLTTVGAASGIVGWIVKRVGQSSSTAAAAGQFVDAFLFMTDTPMKTGGESAGYLKVTIPLLPQGTFRVEEALVA